MNNVIYDFYSQHLQLGGGGTFKSGDEVTTKCPFHQDKSASLSVNMETGLWKCHAASCAQSAGGNMPKFLSLVRGIPYPEATKEVNKLLGVDFSKLQRPARVKKTVMNFPLSEQDILRRHATLISDPKMMEMMLAKYLLSLETITKFQLGIENNRLWIPIKVNNKYVNVRKASVVPTPKGGKILNITGFGDAQLWPLENTEHDIIYIMEGEKDCMLANQMGINAVTVTSGAGVWKTEWSNFFKGKKVYICYDIDDAGVKGAEKVSRNLLRVASSVGVISLPITSPENGDFTDYMKQGGTAREFAEIASCSKEVPRQTLSGITIPPGITKTTLVDIPKQNLFYKRVRVHVRLVGKVGESFVVPKIVKFWCNQDQKTHCKFCSMFGSGEQIIELSATTPEVLKFLNTDAEKNALNIRRDLKITTACKAHKIEYAEHQDAVKIDVMPTIDEQNVEQSFDHSCFIFINLPIELNSDYVIDCIPVPDPKTQNLVYLAYAVTPCQSSIDEFKLTEEMAKQLEVFNEHPEEA